MVRRDSTRENTPSLLAGFQQKAAENGASAVFGVPSTAPSLNSFYGLAPKTVSRLYALAVFSQATYFGSSTSDAEIDFSRCLASHGLRYNDVCRKTGKGEGKEAQRGRLEDRDTFVGDLL